MIFSAADLFPIWCTDVEVQGIQIKNFQAATLDWVTCTFCWIKYGLFLAVPSIQGLTTVSSTFGTVVDDVLDQMDKLGYPQTVWLQYLFFLATDDISPLAAISLFMNLNAKDINTFKKLQVVVVSGLCYEDDEPSLFLCQVKSLHVNVVDTYERKMRILKFCSCRETL